MVTVKQEQHFEQSNLINYLVLQKSPAHFKKSTELFHSDLLQKSKTEFQIIFKDFFKKLNKFTVSFNDITRFFGMFNQNSFKNTFLIRPSYISFDSLQTFLIKINFVLEKSLAICHIIQGHVQQVPLILGSISKTINIFLSILGSTYYLFIGEITATNVNFRFY